LQHGASPHVTARNGYTPLHIAGKKNALDIAEMLLEYNANTNAQSTGGFTPLHLSCQDGHSDMAYLLLANHADPNIASKYHLTPLHLCAQEDRVKCAEALINKHADADAQTLVNNIEHDHVSYTKTIESHCVCYHCRVATRVYMWHVISVKLIWFDIYLNWAPMLTLKQM
jgi:ankyrin repeat protein